MAFADDVAAEPGACGTRRGDGFEEDVYVLCTAQASDEQHLQWRAECSPRRGGDARAIDLLVGESRREEGQYVRRLSLDVAVHQHRCAPPFRGQHATLNAVVSGSPA